MFDFKKSCIIILLLGAFCAFDATAKEKEKEEKKNSKVEAEPEKKKCNKTDSLSQLSEKAIVADSVNRDNNTPSSMSSMSYNILFQVIYRYSFKEIFDSPAASEIVTN